MIGKEALYKHLRGRNVGYIKLIHATALGVRGEKNLLQCIDRSVSFLRNAIAKIESAWFCMY
jgi:hypothetical protein